MVFSTADRDGSNVLGLAKNSSLDMKPCINWGRGVTFSKATKVWNPVASLRFLKGQNVNVTGNDSVMNVKFSARESSNIPRGKVTNLRVSVRVRRGSELVNRGSFRSTKVDVCRNVLTFKGGCEKVNECWSSFFRQKDFIIVVVVFFGMTICDRKNLKVKGCGGHEFIDVGGREIFNLWATYFNVEIKGLVGSIPPVMFVEAF